MADNIQIPKGMFIDVIKLLVLLQNYEVDKTTQVILDSLELQINDKIERIKNRELYTQSKVAASASEREAARQAYLDSVGIHKDWRYSSVGIDK